jgi:hypothetical protein
MIISAYSKTGKQIFLPKVGKIQLASGTIIQENNEFKTLETDCMYIRKKAYCNITQSNTYEETLQPL